MLTTLVGILMGMVKGLTVPMVCMCLEYVSRTWQGSISARHGVAACLVPSQCQEEGQSDGPAQGTLYTLSTPLTFQEALEGMFRVAYIAQVGVEGDPGRIG